ncbi:MAG TPA: pentapeptide repeat-containing protein [Thermoanaerobaculia bacterium]
MNRKRDAKPDDEASLRIRKLELENEKLAHENSPSQKRLEWWKTFAAFSSVITACVAIAGIAVTTAQWRSGISQAEENRAATRLAEGISHLTSARESERLGGIVALTSFLEGDDPRKSLQVIRAIVNQLALEDSELVRRAALSALREFDPRSLPEEDRLRALNSAISVNRKIAYDAVALVYSADPADDQALEISRRVVNRAGSLASVVSLFVRKGVMTPDMTGLYLAGAEFQGLKFPHGTRFTQSNLSGANFAGAYLDGADFSDTDLSSTKFKGAILTGANFTRASLRSGTIPFKYLRIPVGLAGGPLAISGPSFEDADLRRASFKNHTLFGVWAEGEPSVILKATFRGAKLDDTDFVGAGVVILVEPRSRSVLFEPDLNMGNRTFGQFGFSGRLRENAAAPVPLQAELATYRGPFLTVARAFDSSTWCKARLPAALRSILSAYRPAPDALNLCR